MIKIETKIDIKKPIVANNSDDINESVIPNVLDNWIPKNAPPAISMIIIIGKNIKNDFIWCFIFFLFFYL